MIHFLFINMSRSLYIGRSGLGKTHLLTENLFKLFTENNRKIKPRLTIVSPTAPKQPEKWGKLKKWVVKYYPRANPGVANQIFLEAEDIYKKFHKPGRKKTKKPQTMFVVFDDLGESTFLKLSRKENAIREMVTNARHQKCHLIFSMQEFTQAMKPLRKNVDFIYIFEIDDVKEKKLIWEAFCGEISIEEFNKLSTRAWNMDWGYIMIDRSTPKEGKKYYIKDQPYTFN